MAQGADTITYNYSDGTSVAEDVSSINEITVDSCDGAGGNSVNAPAGKGGSASNVVIDVSAEKTLYIWVAESSGKGRYSGGTTTGPSGGGSTEIAFVNTNSSDSSDEPFLVGAGGGGGSGSPVTGGGGGARGGNGDDSDGEGIAPPQGGAGPLIANADGEDGDGAVESRTEIIDSGSTTVGGGSPQRVNGEIQVTYKLVAPTNVQVTDDTTENELTLDWNEVADATSYNVYRAESSGSVISDYTLVAEPSSPPHTDVGLDDNQQYFYRVTSENTNGESNLSVEVNATTVLPSVSNVNRTIRGANVELNWNNDATLGELELQRSTDGFQTVETLESGLPGNTPSFVDTGPQRSQQVEYRVVRQDRNDTAKSTPVQAKLSKFTEVPDAELSTNNKPVFTNIGIPNSASKIKIYRATGVEPVFPGDYSVVQESSSQIAKFRDDAAPSESISSYAFTTIDSNGNESSPDIRQVFAPANDAAVLKDKNTQ